MKAWKKLKIWSRLTKEGSFSSHLGLSNPTILYSPSTFSHSQKLVDACNEYYTKIPHDFGMKKPPMIDSTQLVKREMELLETLGDIEIAMKAVKEEADEVGFNPVSSWQEKSFRFAYFNFSL